MNTPDYPELDTFTDDPFTRKHIYKTRAEKSADNKAFVESLFSSCDNRINRYKLLGIIK